MDKETIFAEALTKQTPEERRQFLESACAGHPELRQEIETLLAAHEDAGSFLNKTPEEFILTADSGRGTEEEDDWDEDAWRELLEPSDNPEHLGKLGPYEVIEVLGRGGFGIVLRAHDSKLHRAVAIKLLAPQLALTGSAVQRFLREAKSTAAVSHNHVIAIHSIDDSSRPPMIVMEYVEGQSLQQKIDNTGALDVKSILRIGMQTASGLAAAHQQGLVHRDIKPANILLENGIERVKLTDFGLARAVDDIGMTRTGQITGTPQYMSPEQAQGKRVDHRTDLFSLGCVMYAMCTGRAAFRADSAMAVMNRVVNDTPRPIREINPDIPEWLCEIVDKLLAKKPDDRFQTAEEVAKLLGDHLAHLQQPDSVPQPAPIGYSRASELQPSTTALDAYDRRHAARTELHETSLPVAETEQVLTLVKGPATGLIVTAVANWIGIPVAIYLIFLKPLLEKFDGGGLVIDPLTMTVMLTLIGIIIMLVTGFMVFGALKMKRLEGYWLAVVGSVLAMIVTPGNLIGLPIGVWSLFVLTRGNVRAAFQRHRTPTESQLSEKTQVKRRIAGIFALACYSLICWWGYGYTGKLAHRYAPSTYSFQDGTPEGIGYPLEPKSRAYLHIHAKTTGSGRSHGTRPKLPIWPREQLTYRLVPKEGAPIHEGLADSALFASGQIEIDLTNGTAFHYRDLDGNRITGDRLTEAEVLEWMKAMGVDVETPGVKREAAWLYDTAMHLRPGKTEYKRIGELVDEIAFRGFGVSSSWEIELDPWVEPTISTVWMVVWLLGVACIGFIFFKPAAEKNASPSGDLAPTVQLDADQAVLQELEKGMVPAIRAYRKQTGAGLADARNAVEQIAREHDIEIPALTPRQRVKQTAITTLTVAVLAWAAAMAIEKGVSTFLVTPAFAVVVAVYLMFLIAMWRGSHLKQRVPIKNWLVGLTLAFVVALGLLEIFQVTQFTRALATWYQGDVPAVSPIPDTGAISQALATEDSEIAPAFAQLADTWDYKQGQEPVRCLDVSPNGKYLVSGHGPVDGQAHVWLWDVGKNFQNDSFAGGEGVKLDAGVNVTDVKFSPDSQFYAWAQDDGYLGRRLTETNHSDTESFLPVPGALFCLAWSPDGSWIVTGGEGRLHIWDAAAEWKNNQKTSPVEEIPVFARLASGKTNVLVVAFSPDGQHLAVGCEDSSVHLFEVKERSLVQTGSLHQYSDGQDDNGAVWSIAWAPDSQSIEYGCENGTIQKRMIDGRGWGQHGGLTTATQVRHYNPVVFSPDGSLIATSEGDDFDREGIPHAYRLSFRSLDGGSRLSARGESHQGEISCLDFTNDGKYLVSGSEDGTIKWWEFAKPLVKDIKDSAVNSVPEKPELSDESNNAGHSIFWRNLVSEGSMVPKVRWANRHVKAELTGGHAGIDSSGSSEFINEQTGESTLQFRGTQQQLADFFSYYKAELRQIAEESGARLKNVPWGDNKNEFHLMYVTPLASGKVGATLKEIKTDPDDETILSGLLTVWMEDSYRSPKAGGNPQAELPQSEDPAPNVLSWKQERAGWRKLFDGKTLDGWDVESGTWKVDNGWIVGEPNGVLHSHRLFDGIELSYEWKTQPYGSINRGRLVRQGDQIIHQVNGQAVPAEELENLFLLLQDGIKLRTGEKRVWFRNLRIQSPPPLQPVLDRRILPTDVWYDLFDRLDPIRHAKHQWWQPAEEGYELTGGMSLSGGGLLVPRQRIDPWADYELETTLTPAGDGGTQVFITFPVGSTTCSLFADKSFANRIGLHQIDGISAARPENPSSLHPSPFQNDVKQTFTITVRSTEKEAHITVKLDGKEVINWRGEFDRINTDSHWRPDETWSFGFGGSAAHDGSLTYHSARLRLLDEAAGGMND